MSEQPRLCIWSESVFNAHTLSVYVLMYRAHSISNSLSPLSSLLQHHRYFVSLAKFLASDDPLLELSLLDHVDAHATKDGILSLGRGGGKKRLRERSRQIGRIHSHGKTLTK